MVSSVCDTAIDGDCSLNIHVTIDTVNYYDREDSRNTSLCGSDKLNKLHIRSADIESELLSTNVNIESDGDIEINHDIDSTATNSLSFVSNESIIISNNIKTAGDILIHVTFRSVS